MQAMEFLVRIRGGGGYGPDDDRTMTNVNVEILNGSKHSVTLETVELPGVTLKDPAGALGLPLIVPPQREQRVAYQQVDIEPLKVPDAQFSGRPFTESTPIVRYRINGARWERVGDDPPIRVGNC